MTKRNQILLAASRIVHKQGVSQLTLEAVANEAGISKGGLLYHFPNKEALVQGMLDELLSKYSNEIKQRVESDDSPSGRWSRAYAEATFHEVESGLEMSSGLLAAVFTNPEMLEKYQQQYSIWQKQIENDTSDPVLATVIRLVADGLWYSEIFGLAPLDINRREQVLTRLLSWTKEEKN